MDSYEAVKTYRIGPFRLGVLQARLTIILGSLVLYTVIVQHSLPALGDVEAALITVPVALTGWFFGIEAGLAASLAGVVLNALLFEVFGGYYWASWLIDSWPGNLMLILMGFVAGLLKRGSDERAGIEMELRARERFLSLINLTTQDILDPKRSDEIYFRVVAHITNLFVADYGYMTQWDAAAEQIRLIASTYPLEYSFPGILLSPEESKFTASIIQTGLAIAIDDASNSPYIITPAPIEDLRLKTRSAFGIPLIAGDYKFGAVILVFNVPCRFTPEEISRAEQLGKQIALALWTTQQKAEIQQRLKEAYALANIERALGETEHVGLDHVLQLIVNSAKELIPGTEQAIIHLLDTEQQVLIPRAVAGFEKPGDGELKMRLGEGVAGQVIAERVIINIADVETDPRFLRQTTPVKFRSLMVSPVQSGKNCLGTISVQSNKPNVFTSDEQQLLVSLGNQAAIAIDNARLFETTQLALKEVNALYEITRRLVGSLETDQLMKDVVNLLQQNFGYYHAQIYIIDPQSGNLIMQQGSGEIGAQIKKRGQQLPAGVGIVGHAAKTGLSFVTQNVEKVIFYIPNPLLPSTRSELAIPIKVNERVLGVLDVQQSPPGQLTERDLQLVGAVADQLAIALHKATLYSDLQASLEQEKAIHSQLMQSEKLATVGRLLASVSHELNNPLQAIQNALFLLKEETNLSNQNRQDLNIILSETERMAALIERLRAAYRPIHVEDFRPVELNLIVEDVYALIATHMRHKEIAFEFYPDPTLPAIAGLSHQLRQVVLNLFLNAVEAMPPGGKLYIQTQNLPGQAETLLSIRDNGPGIDPEILPQIFDPFITSKSTGTGLGLAITQDIIHQHNGRIQAENAPGGGAVFNVWLPIWKGDTA